MPVPTEPVRLTRETGESIKAEAVDRSPTTTWNVPSENPASRNASPRFNADCGDALAGFTTTVLPAIRAGTAKRTICHIGKFHGMIEPRTPRGWNATYDRIASVVTISGCRNPGPFSAKYSAAQAHFSTSATAWRITLPISSVIVWAYVSLCFRRTSAKRNRYAARSFGSSLDQDRKASRAAPTFVHTCGAVRIGYVAKAFSVVGLMTSNVRRFADPDFRRDHM